VFKGVQVRRLLDKHGAVAVAAGSCRLPPVDATEGPR
jgi:hypothetical protein